MSVILEKNRIIITIPTNTPEEDLNTIQSDIIYALQCYDTRNNSAYSFYQLLELLNAIRPNSKIYELMEATFDYNMDPLRETLKAYRPDAVAIKLLEASTYLYKYATAQKQKDVEIEDTIDMLKTLVESIQEGEKVS